MVAKGDAHPSNGHTPPCQSTATSMPGGEQHAQTHTHTHTHTHAHVLTSLSSLTVPCVTRRVCPRHASLHPRPYAHTLRAPSLAGLCPRSMHVHASLHTRTYAHTLRVPSLAGLWSHIRTYPPGALAGCTMIPFGCPRWLDCGRACSTRTV